MKVSQLFSFLLFMTLISSCKQRPTTFANFDAYPTTEKNLWLSHSKEATTFKIWSPTATAVKLNFYKTGNASDVFETHNLQDDENGVWSKTIKGDLHGTYYTYQVYINDTWLAETPGIYAKAVGVNGKKAMVLDFETTHPTNWKNDTYVTLKSPNDAIIYELHIRDITIQKDANSSFPGKYLGLVEKGTKSNLNISTAIDHIKQLGITHVHLLPTFDNYSIDETNLKKPQFNWGYDPQNYNVPEGSFATNPFDAEVRIKEFKTMVKAFHNANIGVILDVVYNHTGRTENSNFNLENPNYYYRFNKDGSYSDAAACGNETASERKMARTFILESVKYWAEEYHLDGFRFDLMGIHDIETMNLIAAEVKKINKNALIYGEGWTANNSPLPEEKRALKKHTQQMPQIAAFSDDLRDGIKGSVFDDNSTGFVSGAENTEESIKFGIVGAIHHPQIDYKAVNYSDKPWANQPWQAINYVSCHDNHTLYDKLKISQPNASEEEIKAMHKLATAIVLTSQGTPFLHAGSEMMRTKNGEHNSYKSPDAINQINWNLKVQHADVVKYYQNLIRLRKEHPAFRMPTANEVQENLEFQKVENGLVSYQIKNNANNDSWKTILIIFNAKNKPFNYKLNTSWRIAVLGDSFDFEGKKTVSGSFNVPKTSMVVLFK
ncbi:type I pullulanase [Polaribacter aestuariivivens]|uniref:Type I pullulanase n=1 Tax=Polaribacter aestuariivivens TaxID=2304626 RepID=A0A5S3NAP2_9FLAO|nr:type I pullulanase [Polaribacter aestuariivivens]TMM32192.1 type I pullulanase [Polaribacter aestuariivivens]